MDVTLDDDYWKDAFDFLKDGISSTKKKQINLKKKNKIDAKYNMDSSVENESFTKKSKKDLKTKLKMLKRTISTPFMTKGNIQDFQCPLSPLAANTNDSFQKLMEDDWIETDASPVLPQQQNLQVLKPNRVGDNTLDRFCADYTNTSVLRQMSILRKQVKDNKKRKTASKPKKSSVAGQPKKTKKSDYPDVHEWLAKRNSGKNNVKAKSMGAYQVIQKVQNPPTAGKLRSVKTLIPTALRKSEVTKENPSLEKRSGSRKSLHVQSGQRLSHKILHRKISAKPKRLSFLEDSEHPSSEVQGSILQERRKSSKRFRSGHNKENSVPQEIVDKEESWLNISEIFSKDDNRVENDGLETQPTTSFIDKIDESLRIRPERRLVPRRSLIPLEIDESVQVKAGRKLVPRRSTKRLRSFGTERFKSKRSLPAANGSNSETLDLSLKSEQTTVDGSNRNSLSLCLTVNESVELSDFSGSFPGKSKTNHEASSNVCLESQCLTDIGNRVSIPENRTHSQASRRSSKRFTISQESNPSVVDLCETTNENNGDSRRSSGESGNMRNTIEIQPGFLENRNSIKHQKFSCDEANRVNLQLNRKSSKRHCELEENVTTELIRRSSKGQQTSEEEATIGRKSKRLSEHEFTSKNSESDLENRAFDEILMEGKKSSFVSRRTKLLQYNLESISESPSEKSNSRGISRKTTLETRSAVRIPLNSLNGPHVTKRKKSQQKTINDCPRETSTYMTPSITINDNSKDGSPPHQPTSKEMPGRRSRVSVSFEEPSLSSQNAPKRKRSSLQPKLAIISECPLDPPNLSIPAVTIDDVSRKTFRERSSNQQSSRLSTSGNDLQFSSVESSYQPHIQNTSIGKRTMLRTSHVSNISESSTESQISSISSMSENYPSLENCSAQSKASLTTCESISAKTRTKGTISSLALQSNGSDPSTSTVDKSLSSKRSSIPTNANRKKSSLHQPHLSETSEIPVESPTVSISSFTTNNIETSNEGSFPVTTNISNRTSTNLSSSFLEEELDSVPELQPILSRGLLRSDRSVRLQSSLVSNRRRNNLSTTLLEEQENDSVPELQPILSRGILRSDRSVRYPKHNKSVRINYDTVDDGQSTTNLHFTISEEDQTLSLHSGKWRKSLSMYRKHQSLVSLMNFTKNTTKSIVGNRTAISLNTSEKSLSPEKAILKACGQDQHIPFRTTYSKKQIGESKKIGEGTYGEVFMTEKKVVLKVIPVEGDQEITGEAQKKFEEVLPEILISRSLSDLAKNEENCCDGFVKVAAVRSVCGSYPTYLKKLWEEFDKENESDNEHPKVFPNDQLYIILELENAGSDLESFMFLNSMQSSSVFLQVTLSLAIAEKAYQFEHRDLHWGNILVKETEEEEIEFKLNGKLVKVPTNGVRATIIDYTLSRGICENKILYNDLSKDDDLFCATGDYQFEIYKLMKQKLSNKWDKYEPYTNLLWLHYLADKMIKEVFYKQKNNKKHLKHLTDTLKTYYNNILKFKSAEDFVMNFLEGSF